MRVHVHASDEGGCGYYRMIWPAQTVAAADPDIEVSVIRPDSEEARLRLQCRDAVRMKATGQIVRERQVIDLEEVPECDVLVLQRPLLSDLADVIPVLQRHGIAVVVEVDDDFHAIHPRNQAYVWCHPKSSPDRNYLHLERACHHADLVTVSTPALARRYGRHGRVAVVPNYLPRAWMNVHPEREPGKVRVGWSGTVESHPTDLQQTGGAVARIARGREDVEIVCVGTGVGVANHLQIESVKASGWVSIEAYPAAMAQVDVGIVPLDQSPFNEAKSWLKGLEFAAAGTPFVASPTQQYRALADAGIGLLAKNAHQWESRLRRLVDDPSWRAEYGLQCRERVLEGFLIDQHAHLWRDAWQRAREHALQRALRVAGVR